MKTLSSIKFAQIYRDVNFLSQKRILIFAPDFVLKFAWPLSQVQRCGAYFQLQFNCSPDVFTAGKWDHKSDLHIQLAVKSDFTS